MYGIKMKNKMSVPTCFKQKFRKTAFYYFVGLHCDDQLKKKNNAPAITTIHTVM